MPIWSPGRHISTHKIPKCSPPRAASIQWTAEHGNWHVTGKKVWQYSKPLIVNISQAIILWFALARASARNYHLLNSPRWPIFSINLWKKQSLHFTTPLTLHQLFQSKLSLILAKDKSKQFHSLIKLWSTFDNAKKKRKYFAGNF